MAWAVACLLAVACSGGEPPRSADRIADRVAAARSDAWSARTPFDARARSGAILRDADLAGAEPSPPPRQATRSPSVPDAPLPPDVAQVLESQTSIASQEESLAITFGDRRREIFRAALGGASVIDDPLPPAAPAHDLP